MSRKKSVKATRFVDDLVSNAVAVAGEYGMPEEKARDAAMELARRLCSQWGKQELYISSAMPWELTERDNNVWAAYSSTGADGTRAFTSARVDQVAKEFDLSPNYIYFIVRLWREKNWTDRQGKLPGIDDAVAP